MALLGGVAVVHCIAAGALYFWVVSIQLVADFMHCWDFRTGTGVPSAGQSS
jgi:hypothetical protein